MKFKLIYLIIGIWVSMVCGGIVLAYKVYESAKKVSRITPYQAVIPSISTEGPKTEVVKPATIPIAVLVVEKKPKVFIHKVSFEGNTLKERVSNAKGKNIKAVLNIGYCSYDVPINQDGSVTIQPEWQPPTGSITFGIYDSDTGKYLSSVRLR
jgi:hypothetical protein